MLDETTVQRQNLFPPLFWLLLIALLVLAGFVFGPFIQAVLWPAILGVLLYPPFNRLCQWLDRRMPKRKEFNRTLASLFTVLGLIFVVLGPLATAGFFATLQAQDLIAEVNAEAAPGGTTLENLAHEVERRLQPTLDSLNIKNVDIAGYIKENGRALAQNAARPLATFFGKLIFAIVITMMSLVTLFYVLRDGHKLREPAIALLPLHRKESELLLERLRRTVFQVAIAVVFVAFIQGLVAGVWFSVWGIKGALLLGCITFLVATIPLLGPPIVYVPLTISLLLQGEVGKAVAVLLFGMAVLSNLDNLLRPYFIKASMPPIGLFFALIGGVIFFGPLGVMLGPLLLSTLLTVSEIIRARKEGKIVGQEETPGEPVELPA